MIPELDFCDVIQYKKKKHHKIIPIIYAKAFEDKPWEDNWDKIDLFDPHGIFLIVNPKNKDIFGFVISFTKDNYGYISVLCILPEYRLQGFGRLLIYRAIKYLSNKNISKIIIDVEKGNISAEKLYMKIGFTKL